MTPHAPYTDDELRAAHRETELPRIGVSFAAAMRDPLYRPIVRAKARDLRNRAHARRPSGYLPGAADIRRTFARLATGVRVTLNLPLPLE